MPGPIATRQQAAVRIVHSMISRIRAALKLPKAHAVTAGTAPGVTCAGTASHPRAAARPPAPLTQATR